MTTLAVFVGWSALVAAVATVVGAALLMLFFMRGQPWGTLNDLASIVLMLATIPVAIAIAAVEAGQTPALAYLVAAVGIVGMLGAAGFQTALVARWRTYEQLLARTLGAGAIVGAWYVLAGALALGGALPAPLPVLAIAAGIGYIAIGYGFWRGGQDHVLAKVGGIVLLLASTSFLALFGIRVLGGEIGVRAWTG